VGNVERTTCLYLPVARLSLHFYTSYKRLRKYSQEWQSLRHARQLESLSYNHVGIMKSMTIPHLPVARLSMIPGSFSFTCHSKHGRKVASLYYLHTLCQYSPSICGLCFPLISQNTAQKSRGADSRDCSDSHTTNQISRALPLH